MNLLHCWSCCKLGSCRLFWEHFHALKLHKGLPIHCCSELQLTSLLHTGKIYFLA